MAVAFLKDRLSRLREELILRAKDAGDVVRGRTDPLVPPRRLLFDGPRDPELYRESGREFLGHYVDHCGLQPGEHILDVGSGIGRKTAPLTGYLDPSARYVGLDVNAVGVEWCRSHIGSRWPNFEFEQIDVYNRRYNPKGRFRDEDYSFPFDDETFDFVVLASVFTHMFPPGVGRYLREAARVLKRGTGRCLISYFLLNPESEVGITDSRSVFHFSHRTRQHAIERKDRPEDAVAYEEGWVRDQYARAGLEISSVDCGSWSGRPGESLSFQDLVLAFKRGPEHS